ncbi:30S ribosomal protein S17 [uncultured archaeon]|nr:30S ribosomal protein S17 [uncultured archaeon]
MARNIGLDVKLPEQECNDQKCPFHGTLSIRGQIIGGIVESPAMNGSAVIKRTHQRYLPKYERKLTLFSKYHAHVPECIQVKPGDTVKIAECRKLAKTVSFVVVEKVNP